MKNKPCFGVWRKKSALRTEPGPPLPHSQTVLLKNSDKRKTKMAACLYFYKGTRRHILQIHHICTHKPAVRTERLARHLKEAMRLFALRASNDCLLRAAGLNSPAPRGGKRVREGERETEEKKTRDFLQQSCRTKSRRGTARRLRAGFFPLKFN